VGIATTLLSLPPEIRNRIDEFALNSNGALFYFASDAASKRRSFFFTHRRLDSHSPTEFDQLQFVNRQLYSETAGLEIKYSPYLAFYRYTPELPQDAQAVEFLLSISAKRRHWVSKIEIFAGDIPKDYQAMLLDTPEILSSLDDIYLERWYLTIQYHPALWYSGPTPEDYERCAYICAAYSLIFRGDDKDTMFAPTATFQPVSMFRITRALASNEDLFFIKQAKKWREEVELFLKAPNFRFFPSVVNENRQVVHHPIGPIELEYAFVSSSWINPEIARRQIIEWYMQGL